MESQANNRLCHKFFIGSDITEVIHKIYSDGFKYRDGKYQQLKKIKNVETSPHRITK